MESVLLEEQNTHKKHWIWQTFRFYRGLRKSLETWMWKTEKRALHSTCNLGNVKWRRRVDEHLPQELPQRATGAEKRIKWASPEKIQNGKARPSKKSDGGFWFPFGCFQTCDQVLSKFCDLHPLFCTFGVRFVLALVLYRGSIGSPWTDSWRENGHLYNFDQEKLFLILILNFQKGSLLMTLRRSMIHVSP